VFLSLVNIRMNLIILLSLSNLKFYFVQNSYRNNNKGNGWEKNKRAVFVHDDIEVYEVQGNYKTQGSIPSKLNKIPSGTINTH